MERIPAELEGVLTRTADTLGGSVRFVGTRVPLRALLDTVAEGGSLVEFVEGWPDVSADQARAVLAYLDRQNRRTFGLERAA